MYNCTIVYIYIYIFMYSIESNAYGTGAAGGDEWHSHKCGPTQRLALDQPLQDLDVNTRPKTMKDVEGGRSGWNRMEMT